MARVKKFNRNEMLTRAMVLFWTKGYQATSAQDLVDALGISRSSLYDTFGDKRSLFLEALKEYKSKIAGNTIHLIESSTSARDAIRKVFEQIINQAVDKHAIEGCLMTNTAVELRGLDKEIVTVIGLHQKEIEKTLARKIETDQENGLVSTRQSPEDLARFFYNSVVGVQVLLKNGVDKKSIANTIQIAISVLD